MIDVSPDPIRMKRLVLYPLRLEHSGPMWEVLREPEIYTWKSLQQSVSLRSQLFREGR
jgi:hypothetical protein